MRARRDRSFVALLACIAIYALARTLPLVSALLSSLLIVVFHVVPPALFAYIHATRTYGTRLALSFFATCLGTGFLFEALSLRSGFPFGHYVFTGVMGPKLLQVPLLLALAYVGIGYTAWVLALTLLRQTSSRLVGWYIVLVSMLASLVFTMWDISMEADWSTLDHAWIWRDGGSYFGVPVSNFLGWYLVGYIFYQLFALQLRDRKPRALSSGFWRLPVYLYAICAAGNLLLLVPVSTAVKYPVIVYDPASHAWHTASMFLATALVSVFGMGSFAAFAWRRAAQA